MKWGKYIAGFFIALILLFVVGYVAFTFKSTGGIA